MRTLQARAHFAFAIFLLGVITVISAISTILFVSSQAPTVPIITYISPTPNDGTYTKEKNITINLTVQAATSPITSCILTWNGANNTMTLISADNVCNYTKLNLADGDYIHKVIAIDSGTPPNNLNQTLVRIVSVDSTNPQVSFTAPTFANETLTNRTKVVINVSVTETNHNEIVINFDGNNYSMICSSGVNFFCHYINKSVAKGNYTYFVYVSDLASNSNQTEKRFLSISPISWNVTSSPADGEINVSLSSEVEINFNRAMNQALAQGKFSITPTISGNLSWNGNILIFKHADFPQSITYIVKIKADAEDSDGNLLGEDFGLAFTTTSIKPRVNSTTPPAGAVNVSLTADILISFGDQMDQTATQQAFSIAPAVQGAFTWPDTSTLVFNPSTDLQEGILYIVQISQQAKSIYGAAADSYTFSFTTFKRIQPAVASSSPTKNLLEVTLNSTIKIKFNKAMDKQSVEQGFSIEPDVEGDLEWQDDVTLNFIPKKLKGNTQYKVTIVNSKDSEGLTLPVFELQFTTEKEKKPIRLYIFLVILNLFIIILIIYIIVKRKQHTEGEYGFDFSQF